MDQIVMWIMAVGAVLGGVDYLFGSKWGLGKKFEEGFLLLGTTALSMAGIICLAPLIGRVIGPIVTPLYQQIGVDPSLLGGILALDMGGFQLAGELALDAKIGRYAGIIVGCTFGCTVSFTIPVGIGMIREQDRPYFAKGVLLGLIALPAALVTGALASGLTFAQALWQNVPVFALSALFLIGLVKCQEQMLRGFGVFASGLRALITVGLILAAVEYMTGIALLPGMAPIEDAMAVVSAIGVVMLGSLPVAEILTRVLKRPFAFIAGKFKMDEKAVAGLLLSMVSSLPVLAMLKDMDPRGKVVNIAFIVSGTAVLAAHLGFTISAAPEMLGALFAAKRTGGFAGAALALAATRKKAD